MIKKKTIKKITRFIGISLKVVLIIILSLLSLSSILWKSYIQGIILICAVLILIRPIRKLIDDRYKVSRWIYPIAVIALLFAYSLVGKITAPDSVFVFEDTEEKLMEIYNQKMESWPGSYEEKVLSTGYGSVYVAISGPKDAPPLLLYHASALPTWAWQYIIEDLIKEYRVYSIDTIGEASKSRLNDVNNPTRTGDDLADLYNEISEKLGINRSIVIGASNGGYIALNYASDYPDKVDKLILIAPMGITDISKNFDTLGKMIFVSFFPIGFLQEDTMDWMAGSDYARDEIRPWMDIVLDEVMSKEAPPLSISRSELAKIEAKTLLLLGKRDPLVGDTDTAIEYTSIIKDITVHTLDTGHTIWIEEPQKVNLLIDGFLD